LLGFIWFHSSESGLFNELRRFQIKKFSPWPQLASELCAEGFERISDYGFSASFLALPRPFWRQGAFSDDPDKITQFSGLGKELIEKNMEGLAEGVRRTFIIK
jgi:hypothetical protein